jgi:hypothetical protein
VISFAKEENLLGACLLTVMLDFSAGIECGVESPIMGVLKWMCIVHPKNVFASL